DEINVRHFLAYLRLLGPRSGSHWHRGTPIHLLLGLINDQPTHEGHRRHQSRRRSPWAPSLIRNIRGSSRDSFELSSRGALGAPSLRFVVVAVNFTVQASRANC